MSHCDSLSFPAFIHIPLRLIFSRSYVLTNKFAYFSTCSLIRFWHNVEGPRLIFLLWPQQLCLDCTADIQAISVVLKFWDVISALRAHRRRVSGREDRCRCHEVALVVSWMAEELRVVPKRIAILRSGQAPNHICGQKALVKVNGPRFSRPQAVTVGQLAGTTSADLLAH